jgi:predicted transcriptional regulator
MTRSQVVIVPDGVEVVRQGVLAEMLDAGVTVREIADEVGITPQAVQYHLRRLGYAYNGLTGWRRA